MGVAAVSYPRLMSTGAVRGMINAMEAFTDMVAGGQPVDRPDLVVSFDEINDLVGFDELVAMERDYAPDAAAAEDAAVQRE